MGDFNGSSQVHDWDPGVAPSGLFWTIPISDGTNWIDAENGPARFRARDLAMPDFHDFGNAVGLASPPVPAMPSHVTFDVRWRGGGTRTEVHDTTFGFEGDFVAGPVSIDFSTRQDGRGVTYRSDPADQITVSGGAGRERNGVFFQLTKDGDALQQLAAPGATTDPRA